MGEKMKGIILAGGLGTRLYPLTVATSKQLLPVYDKPMIYYCLSTLMLAGIREILIISTARDIPRFEELLGDGSQLGVSLCYRVQSSPADVAQAFILGDDFLNGDAGALILGDNFFYGDGLSEMLREAVQSAEANYAATVFSYYVKDPENYGIVSFDDNYMVTSIEEKPRATKSNFAVTGLYFYPPGVVEKVKAITPSIRGELEITDLNKIYLREKRLNVKILGSNYVWFDLGTIDNLIEASYFVYLTEKRDDMIISAPEEIAYKNGWINKSSLLESVARWKGSQYGMHLQLLSKGRYSYDKND